MFVNVIGLVNISMIEIGLHEPSAHLHHFSSKL